MENTGIIKKKSKAWTWLAKPHTAKRVTYCGTCLVRISPKSECLIIKKTNGFSMINCGYSCSENCFKKFDFEGFHEENQKSKINNEGSSETVK